MQEQEEPFIHPEVFRPILNDLPDENHAHSLLLHLRELYDTLKKLNGDSESGWNAMRELCISRFGYGIPTVRACKCLAQRFKRALHVNAGTAYWSRVLRDQGIQVEAIAFEKPPYQHIPDLKIEENMTAVAAIMTEGYLVPSGQTRDGLTSDDCCLIVDWFAPFWWDFLLTPSSPRWVVAIAPAFLFEYLPAFAGGNARYQQLVLSDEEKAELLLPEWPGLEVQISIWRKADAEPSTELQFLPSPALRDPSTGYPANFPESMKHSEQVNTPQSEDQAEDDQLSSQPDDSVDDNEIRLDIRPILLRLQSQGAVSEEQAKEIIKQSLEGQLGHLSEQATEDHINGLVAQLYELIVNELPSR